MADSLVNKPKYLDKPSLAELLKSRLNVSERWLQLAVPLAVFLVILLPRLLNLGTFITADEDDQVMFATHFLKSVLRGNWAGALVLGYPGVPTMLLGAIGVGLRYAAHYGGWLPLPWVTADFNTTLDQLTTSFGVFQYPLDFLVWVRMPLALVASISIFGIYLLIRRLLDEKVALLAALILAFDPFVLAHSRVIHVDAPLSYFMFLSFLAFMLYLDRGAWKWLLLSGVFGGLAGLSKTPAGLLGPILVTSGIIFALFPAGQLPAATRWKRLAVALVVWGMVAVAAIFALWPSMWSRPFFAISALIRNLYVVSGAHPTTGIFWGGQQSDQNPLYYLIVLPYHLTPLTSIGLAAGLALIGAGLIDRWRKVESWPARVLPLAMALLAYVVLFMAPVSVISRRGDRYILPVFFAVGLLAALALWWLAQLLARRAPALLARLRLSPARLVGGALLVQALFVLAYHPYYLAYFNPLLGGYRTAPYRINVGWGEGLDLAASYLNQMQGAEPLPAAAWYSNQFGPYYQGQTIDLSSTEAALTADYTVFYINQVQRGFPSQEILNYFRQREPLHVVKLGGIEYAWIYKGPVIGQEPHEGAVFPVEALLGGGARLYGVDVPILEMPADTFGDSAVNANAGPYLGFQEVREGLPVTLYWQTIAPIYNNHGKTNVYIRLVDAQGAIWGRVDRLILDGLWRTSRWNPGYYLRDEYKLPIDPATPPGTYHLEVGLYDFETSQSYGVVKNIGQIILTPAKTAPTLAAVGVDPAQATPIDGRLALVKHDYVDAQLPPGAEVSGKIFWQATQPIDTDHNLEFAYLGPDRKKYVIAEQPLSAALPMPQWRRDEVIGAAYKFRIPAFAPSGEYPMQATVIDPATGNGVGQPVTLANIHIEERNRNFELPENVVPVSAVVGDEIELVGYRLHDETVAPRGTFGLTLYWRSLKFAGSNYTVFVHAVGPDHSIRGQWDSVPVHGTSPTSGWLPGEIIEDHYEVPMARKAPAWKYDIFVGMYDATNNLRLPIYSPTAPVSEDRVWLTRVQQLAD